MKLYENKNYGWLIVISYSLLGMFFPAAVTQFSMSVTEIASEMGVSKQTILLSDTFRAVCLVIGMFMSEIIYKKIGLKKTIALGISFQIISQFFLPIAVTSKSLLLVYFFKGMQGFNSIAFPLYIATIISWINPQQKGISTAIFNGSFTAGAGIGAWISGKLIPLLGWKMSFYTLATITLIFAIPAIFLTRSNVNNISINVEKKEKSSYGNLLSYPTTWVLTISLLAYTWVTQSITVDMPIYSAYLNYSYAQTGSLMIYISIITIIFSISGGFISDVFAKNAKNKLKARVSVLVVGYMVSIIASLVLPNVAPNGFIQFAISGVCVMLGVAWAQGVFWSIPSEIFSQKYIVTTTSLCSGTSNIVNPVAPMVVGVIFGSNGMWNIAWLTCSIACAISFIAGCILPMMNTKKYK